MSTISQRRTVLLPRQFNDGVVPCANCPKFKDETREMRHQHYAARTSPHHFCSACRKHFSSSAILHKHRHEAHYFCEDCDRFFDSRTGLSEHHRQASIHQDPQSLHVCAHTACDKRFQARGGLHMHLRAVHGVRAVACPLAHWTGCPRRFMEIYDAFKHIERRGCASVRRRGQRRYYHPSRHLSERPSPSSPPLPLSSDVLLTVDIAAAATRVILHEAHVWSRSHTYETHSLPTGEIRFQCPYKSPNGEACYKTCERRSAFLEHVFNGHSVEEGRSMGLRASSALLSRVQAEVEERLSRVQAEEDEEEEALSESSSEDFSSASFY